ncbi:MAG: acyl-[acyl-carrier-protein] thioesterase [Lachnospiraceae bacterium]|nr:acyl-[acyl-carrier-protein] thioesterase [Lachnospiraceae bacterium]
MYEFQSRIRYSELDSRGTLSLPALLDYFQDCSTFHSEELGLGVAYLKEHKMIWALTSWQIVIKRYPSLGETVTIGTAPYDFRGFIGFRNFWMLDEKGQQAAVANSVWSLIHMETGKPTKPRPEMYEGYTLSPKLQMDYADRKVKFAGEGKAQESMVILPHHLDTNHHVNNGQYVRIAMDYLPEGFEIGQLRAEYKKQALLNTRLYPVIYQEGGMIGVSLQDKTGGIYCNVEFK